MKKIWVYLLGVLTGVVLMYLVALVNNRTSNLDYTFFDEPGDVVDARSYTVFQAGDGNALAYEHVWDDSPVLLWNEERKPYYDGQEIIPKKGECFRQIGIYKYTSQDGTDRTVPIVSVMEGGEQHLEEVGEANTNFVLFDAPGDVMPDKSYKVSKILNDSCVIAKGKGDWYNKNDDCYPGMEVLILDQKASTYYNDQIIKAPNGKCFKQMGTYKTDGFMEKVIPVVKLVNK
ncbi:MAG: hypothetical protein ACTTKO_03910 [Candidatus Limimorpha sp.]